MKEAVLLIGRGDIFRYYIQGMIDVFSKNYQVLVIDKDDISYTGEHIRIDMDFNKKRDIDWQKVQQAEKELKLNLYESYSNYFYYGRLAQEANIRYSSYWRSKEKLACVYLNSYDVFSSIIKEYDLKFAFHDTIDQIWTQVLEAFSKKENFGFFHTLIKSGIFNNRVILSSDIPRVSRLFYKNLNNFSSIKSDEQEMVNNILNKFNASKPVMGYMSARSQKILSFSEVKRIIPSIKNIRHGAKRLINRIWLEKVTITFDIEKCGEYILYFMAHQPEASTTSAAQKYVDQWKIVEDIAVNSPSNINVVIKPHPFGYGWQGKEYYEKLIRLPNVYMAPVTYDGKTLIKNAKAVLTINGSIGLEAMIYDIPSYTLGNAWYSHPEYIENLDSPIDILDRLENLRILTHEQKVKVLLAAYRSSVDYFIHFLKGEEDKKIKSGENLAHHILENKEIYFNRENETYGL